MNPPVLIVGAGPTGLNLALKHQDVFGHVLCLSGYGSRTWVKKLLREPRDPHFFGNTKIDEMDAFHAGIGIQKSEHLLGEQSTARAGDTYSNDFFAVLVHVVAADNLSLAADLWQVKRIAGLSQC